MSEEKGEIRTDKEAWLRICQVCGEETFGLCGERPMPDDKCSVCGQPLLDQPRYVSIPGDIQESDEDEGDLVP